MNETALSNHIRMEASDLGATLFRNQTGRYKLEDGRWLTSGLCVGSSDLIGWTRVEITPAMVGQHIAVFTAVEVKSPNVKPKGSKEQEVFISAVDTAGGIAMVTNNLDEFMATLKAKTILK